MKVWQAGSHLMDERGAQVHDWSWRRTRRRIAMLVRLALPYRARTALAVLLMKSVHVFVCIASPMARNPTRFETDAERARLRM